MGTGDLIDEQLASEIKGKPLSRKRPFRELDANGSFPGSGEAVTGPRTREVPRAAFQPRIAALGNPFPAHGNFLDFPVAWEYIM